MLSLIRAALHIQAEDEGAQGQGAKQLTAKRVRRLRKGFGRDTCSTRKLIERLGLRHRTNFVREYLYPGLEAGLVAMVEPYHPRSPWQRYRLTGAGRHLVERRNAEQRSS